MEERQWQNIPPLDDLLSASRNTLPLRFRAGLILSAPSQILYQSTERRAYENSYKQIERRRLHQGVIKWKLFRHFQKISQKKCQQILCRPMILLLDPFVSPIVTPLHFNATRNTAHVKIQTSNGLILLLGRLKQSTQHHACIWERCTYSVWRISSKWTLYWSL